MLDAIANRPVRAAVRGAGRGKAWAEPRESWEQLFRSQGMQNPLPRIRMLDGFNEGWIEFENGEAASRKGQVALKTVLQALIERENH
jgi:hypothetical protein